MIRSRRLWLEELLITQAIPGFLFCVGWVVMYEVYHEDGSFYTTLLQEILGEEGFFPLFLISAVLMAFPVGLVIDAIRGAADSRRFVRAARLTPERRSLYSTLLQSTPVPATFRERYLLLQFAQSTLITPAKGAGNLAIVFSIFLIWFVVKIVRIEGWHVFSLAFIIGTPVVGLVLILALTARYRTGTAEFREFLERFLPAAVSSVAPSPAGGCAPARDHPAPAPDVQM